jgi:hypothetical protein
MMRTVATVGLVLVLALMMVVIGFRFWLAIRMAKGNKRAGRPWWKGNGR